MQEFIAIEAVLVQSLHRTGNYLIIFTNYSYEPFDHVSSQKRKPRQYQSIYYGATIRTTDF